MNHPLEVSLMSMVCDFYNSFLELSLQNIYLVGVSPTFRKREIDKMLKRRMAILAVSAVILASLTVQGALACTTLTPGYWKNHPAAWPMSGMITVGAVGYDLSDSGDVDALMDILWDQPKGDKWITLAQKVIAAQLSMMVYPGSGSDWSWPGNFGGYPGGMEGMVDDANVLLAMHSEYRPKAPGRADVVDLAEIMDDWLNFWDEHGL